MKHCYIFNYGSKAIQHVIIPEDKVLDEDIEEYLYEKYDLSMDEIHFMTSYEPLEIEDL